MFNPLPTACGRRLLLLLCLGGLALTAAPALAAKRPYVETEPKRGFHLFTRPKKKNPADQWQYVQTLDAAGKSRAAARQAYALRLYWPQSPEAPQAQLLQARILEHRGRSIEAFDAYQHLVETWPGHFEFNDVLTRQMTLARAIMERRKGKFLFLPGFTAPERAIPYFEKIAQSAPESDLTAEAFYHIGAAHERTYEYVQAIDAYFTTLNRFPGSPFAEPAAFGQARCHVRLAGEAPEDNRAVETAIAACDLYLQRHPAGPNAQQVRDDQAGLRRRQAANAFARARYYDRILRKPEAALIEYQAFLNSFPNADEAPKARRRVRELTRNAPPAPPENAP